jgi:hypothetical protein
VKRSEGYKQRKKRTQDEKLEKSAQKEDASLKKKERNIFFSGVVERTVKR